MYSQILESTEKVIGLMLFGEKKKNQSTAQEENVKGTIIQIFQNWKKKNFKPSSNITSLYFSYFLKQLWRCQTILTFLHLITTYHTHIYTQKLKQFLRCEDRIQKSQEKKFKGRVNKEKYTNVKVIPESHIFKLLPS